MLGNLHLAGKIVPIQGKRGGNADKHPDRSIQSARRGGLLGDRGTSLFLLDAFMQTVTSRQHY